jgi:undecaprenyl-diphosphatase
LLAVAIVVGFRTRRILLPALAYLALVVGQISRTALNQSIDRTRPPREDWLVYASGRSMPSGHSATAVMAWSLVLALVWSLLPTSALRRLGVAVTAVIALLVGASRVYLGVHWPSDVIAGWAFGAAWVGLCVLGWRWLTARRATV